MWRNRVAACLITGVMAVACGSDGGTTFDAGGGGGGGDGGGGGGNDATTFWDTGTVPDGGGGCVPKTCADLGYDCGQNTDGCGNVIDCGTCTAPNICGGGGFSKCGVGTTSDGGTIVNDGGGTCVPTTCQALGYNCGPAGDGCGGLLQCGTCSGTDICGGGGPGVCGAGSTCTGLCLQQVTCDGGPLTTLTGRVVAGTLPIYGNPDPVPNVLVFVPNGPLQAFTKGVQCSQCGADVSGNPLVQTKTAVDGTFTLTNVPVGNNIPVVIQLGRWRRQVSFNVTACASASVGDIRMPRNKSEGDIPLTGFSTGNVDALECVLLKMGVDSAEFTNPGAGGRIEMYRGNGVRINNATPAESTLTNTLATMDQYDQLFFPCWGVSPTSNNSSNRKTATQLANLVSYTDAGGRAFATHYSYAWLYQNSPFNQTATWTPNAQMLNSATGQIDTSFPKGSTFAQWMALVGALDVSTNPPQMTISAPRQDFSAVTSPALRWMYTVGQNPDFPLHYTFDTPWNSATQCGKVIFSDFHVTAPAATTFPADCSAAPMTGQEKALEYMIWDLASCVPPPPQPACTPITCAQQGIECGPAGDGCGNLLDCGTCTAPATCGGGGPGKCGAPDAGTPTCTPTTCQALGYNCGPAGDGCGGLLDCGTCIAPDTCGGAGQSGVCGHTLVQ